MIGASHIQGAKYLWRVSTHDQNLVAHIAATFNISYPIAQTLISRGYSDDVTIRSFLFTSHEQDVAHPSLMKGMIRGAERIITAIEKQEQILVFGDYDVDGITSSSLMMICLLPLGARINFFLPHRVRDGYGLSVPVVERAARNGYSLIITVDNGITAFEPAQRARELGIDLIITDHHKPHSHVPDAFTIINPHQHDCTYPFKTLAGVGVTFKLLSYICELKGITLPEKAYELLLLGTIADVVPLIGENRFWVRHGLHRVNVTESLAFKRLKINGKLQEKFITARDIGFGIAPQLNALGRLEDPRRAVKFLIGTNNLDIDEVGTILAELNETRKHIEQSILGEIVDQIEQKKINITDNNCIIAAHTNWPPGVIGLVASRLVGAYGKPTILLHETHTGILKGSCRSIPEFNMFNALDECKQHLLQFGGHAQAAGLSLHKKNLAPFQEALEKIIQATLTPFDLQQKITIDADARLPDITKKIIQDMEHLEPFGHQNQEPIFLFKSVHRIQQPQLLKDRHVKCMIFAEGIAKPIIFFNQPHLYEQLLTREDPFDVAAQVHQNYWNGKLYIELTGIDIAI